MFFAKTRLSKVECLKILQRRGRMCPIAIDFLAAGSESHIEHLFRKRKRHAHCGTSNLDMPGMSDTIRGPLGLRVSGDLRFACVQSFSLVAEISKPEFCTIELFGTRSNAQKGSAVAPDCHERRSLPCRCLVHRYDGRAVLRKRLAFSLR